MLGYELSHVITGAERVGSAAFAAFPTVVAAVDTMAGRECLAPTGHFSLLERWPYLRLSSSATHMPSSTGTAFSVDPALVGSRLDNACLLVWRWT